MRPILIYTVLVTVLGSFSCWSASGTHTPSPDSSPPSDTSESFLGDHEEMFVTPVQDEFFPRTSHLSRELLDTPVETLGSPDVVVAMLHDVMEKHLKGCYKMILSSEELSDVAAKTSKSSGEGIFVWNIDTFLTATPPSDSILHRPHPFAQGSYCLAVIVLADLQAVSVATRLIQRGDWFIGADKMVLAYTRGRLLLEDIAQDSVLGSGYQTVVASWRPVEEKGEEEAGHLFHARASGFFQLFRTCPFCRNGSPEVTLADHWVPLKGFVFERPLYPDDYKNFQGHRFNIVTLEYAPFSCYDKMPGGGVRLRDCVDTRMLNSISAALNFTFDVREPKDGHWGYKLDSGNYTGVIGAVQRYEADFSLNVAFTGDREKVIDYTVGYFNDPLTFCTTKPRPLNQALALVKPFRPEVWAGFAAVLVVVGPLYFISCKQEEVGGGGRKEEKDLSHPSLSKALMTIYGACLSQSARWSRGNGARVLVASWILFSLVTLTSYVAMLTASFTLPTLSPTLNSLEELVHSDFSWGIQDQGAADYQLLKTSTVPLYQRVFEGLDLCPSLDECLSRARDSKYAFITWRLYMEDRIAIRFTSATGERQLHVAATDFFPSEIGWAMNPGCPFRHVFNRQIRSLLEAGLISKWLREIIEDPKRREATVGEGEAEGLPEGPKPLGLDQLQGLFYILVLGALAAAFAFTLELALAARK